MQMNLHFFHKHNYSSTFHFYFFHIYYMLNMQLLQKKLSMKIMEMYYASENTPTKLAIDFLKKEIKSFVG